MIDNEPGETSEALREIHVLDERIPLVLIIENILIDEYFSRFLSCAGASRQHFHSVMREVELEEP